MLKKILLPITLLFCLFNLNAQEKNSIKLAIETGFLPLSSDSENLGLFLTIEPKVKVLEKIFIGLRIGATLNSQTFENNANSQYIIHEEYDHGIISFVPTFDYYLSESDFRPYLGLGLGFHLLSDVDVSLVTAYKDTFEVRASKQIGLLLRAGLEPGKLRLGLEYSFIPKANIEIPSGEAIGTVDNSYFGLSIGLIIGGKKA